MKITSIKSRFLLMAALGFYSGLPLALTASTLTAWLADAKIDRAAIGLFAAVGTPYALKFLWAPLVDGVRLLPRFGRRRGWLLLVQALLAAAMAGMGLFEPATAVGITALMAVTVATLSATQDIVIDAYRVERMGELEQGSGAAYATFGYRIGMLVSGAGALALADAVGWRETYFIMAGLMGSAVLVTLAMKEAVVSNEWRVVGADGATSEASPLAGEVGGGASNLDSALSNAPPPSLPRKGGGTTECVATFIRTSVIAPFADFMTRKNWLAVLGFVVLYKLGDAFMGAMFNPFLIDIGFTKTDIAKVVKFYGLIATLLGVFVGGSLVAKVGMFRALMLSGIMHMLTNLLLVEQAYRGADIHFLTLSISLENFTGGMSTAAFIAYISNLCRVHYTATQYALLSSFAAFGRTWLSTPSGALAQAVGWPMFFAIASLMAVPGMVLLWWLQRRTAPRHPEEAKPT
jgi:PAT family beta-lactamase induction signal transducer AmpG